MPIMPSTELPVVFVLGATGAGKSQLALEIAQKFNGEIISADAMQMYKGLDIITNKVTLEERKMVKHHVIDFLNPLSVQTVVEFQKIALPIVEDLLQRNTLPVVCGGTNYYIESLLWKTLLNDEAKVNFDELRPKRQRLDISESEDDDDTDPQILYEKLKKVDPERANELHPNDKRKVLRSLEVFRQYNRKHSEILSEQKSLKGGGFLGGPLRYPKSVVFWVQCDQNVLDERCYKRVDKMVERGLIRELEDFHREYNSIRSKPDYTVGIFQSIGFKEFHEYLTLTTEEKASEKGQHIYNLGLDLMKTATRQYARKQTKWIRNRFLNPKRSCPPVYAFDSTDPERWNETSYLPAVRVLESLLTGQPSPQEPVPTIPDQLCGYEEKMKIFHCDVCDKMMKGSIQYNAHVNGRVHKAQEKKLRTKDLDRTTVERANFENLSHDSKGIEDNLSNHQNEKL